MRAVILATGIGTRMNGHAGRRSRALLEVGGESRVQRQVRLMRRAGVNDIALVVGCQAAAVWHPCREGVCVENERYAETDSLCSLWLARPLLYDGYIVLNCDVLFHPQLLSDLLLSRHEPALMLDCRRADAPALGEEEMKVRVRAGRVVEMGKSVEPGGRRPRDRGHRPLRRVRRAAPRGDRDARVPVDRSGLSGGYERAVAEILPRIDDAPAMVPALTVLRPTLAHAASR